MSTLLRLRQGAFDRPFPADGSSLSPDRIAGLSPRDIAALPLAFGSQPARAGDFFSIEGSGSEEVVMEGDLGNLARLGAGMTRGRLSVHGSAGPCAGSSMRGGVLRITGDAGARAGEGIRGGALVIDGSAGDHLAAPLPGESHGMSGGVVRVGRSAGAMAGFRMRRGTILIEGDAGPGAGTAMVAGSLFVLGLLDRTAGALMRRGTIVAARTFDPLAVFLPSGAARQPFLRLYYDAFELARVTLPPGARDRTYIRYVGDISMSGQGEILILEAAA